MIRVFIAVFSLVCAFSGQAIAGPHRVIDLRTRTDGSGEYELGFCARPSPDVPLGVPGHAFVSFSAKPSGSQRTYVAVGHTTKAAVPSVVLSYVKPLGPVSGYLGEELYTAAKEQCLVAQVNKEDYDKAFALTKDPLAGAGLAVSAAPVRLAYSLGERDCITFMTQVIQTIGGTTLKVPPRKASDLPLSYLRRLIEEN